MKRSEMVLSRSKAQMKKDMELMMKEIKSLSVAISIFGSGDSKGWYNVEEVAEEELLVVESGGKNIEVAVMTREGLRQLEEAELETIVVEIKAEKAAAEAAKKDPEKYFELMDIPEDSQVKYVAYKLRGAASSWPASTKATNSHMAQDEESNVRAVSSDLHLVINYLCESDAQQVVRFNIGLRYDIQAIVSLQVTWTLDEAVRIALRAKQTINKQGNGSSIPNAVFEDDDDHSEAFLGSSEEYNLHETYCDSSQVDTKETSKPYKIGWIKAVREGKSESEHCVVLFA
ncbi:hypothetical protein Tco_1044975 [Tanacetum coccineum]|uniref:Uncharacterized protein n=1 Tax=Tanacetum coccineum TaxID=301880 RepID=A0ABQ5GS85_9ASTR